MTHGTWPTARSVVWRPTTGEFGPRGGLGDLEYHTKLATQFGISAGHSREARYANDSVPPNATQIKLSDGVNPFDADALAPGVTVQKLDYDEMAADAGFKYRGFSFQSEYYWRRLSAFQTVGGPAPMNSIFDHGFQVQGMHMVVPRSSGSMPRTGKYSMTSSETRTRSRKGQTSTRVERAAGGSTCTSFTSGRARPPRTSVLHVGQTGTTLSRGSTS
jgi:hypothetical protein